MATAIIYAATLPPQPERARLPPLPHDDERVFDESGPEIEVQIVEELPVIERLLRWIKTI